MGGNALSIDTKRINSDEYFVLCDKVKNILSNNFSRNRIEIIPSYRNKETFGDMDILLEDLNIPTDIKGWILSSFNSKEIVKNGPCISFEYENFQIDLILMSSENFQTALDYYSNSDLGNLLGRIAYRMGFKYSHKGLEILFRDGTYQFFNHIISKDTNKILEFMGYDSKVWNNGFDTLEDIYTFASSTLYFNKEIFSYENRNHTARVRDKKRPTYKGFTEWLETQSNLPKYDWGIRTSESGGRTFDQIFIKRSFEFFPEFEEIYTNIMQDFNTWKKAKEIFNGAIVSNVTSLKGKELGYFMKTIKDKLPHNKDEWIVSKGKNGIVSWIKQEFDNYDRY